MKSSWATPTGLIGGQALAHFEQHLENVYRRRDRVFTGLMAAQWLFGVLIAVTLSPSSWTGSVRSVHPHVYYAVFVGGAISATSMGLTLLRPGWVVTRHVVAVAQMLWSGLLIHLSGGRIETHFHVFGSLAFLAFYRDWKVLMTGTAVVVVDHLLRGLTWPESIYGIANPEWWRFLEHALWVVFEDTVLLMGIVENRREMMALAMRHAELESLNGTIEQKVVQRTEELAASREQYRALVESTRSVPWQWHLGSQRFIYVGPQGATLLGCSVDDWLRPNFWEERMHPDDRAPTEASWLSGKGSNAELDLEFRLRRNDGAYVTVRTIISNHRTDDSLRGFMLDITEQRQLEVELNHAQKLESVGRLASGIAHEINTPIQFINDSVHFVRDAFDEAQPLLEKYKALRAAAVAGPVTGELLSEIDQAEETADLPYLLEHVPKALERSIDGLARVATLVLSMKDFAHPDQKEKASADLNHALSTTLTIARNEYKYVADVETDFGELPPVLCHVNALNQAFLNLIVNASHAIAETVQGTDGRGRIRVATRRDGDHVLISISDTGGGIPESIRSKIFEPFFTTKAVGKGTGQGLSIARNIVVDKHGGTLTFESKVGVGTTFVIRLPTPIPVAHAPAAAA
ncbi:MAG: PAS domain-containing protein [Archangium sp.]|nr:PAS domain-containing protein [Archangium sp.]